MGEYGMVMELDGGGYGEMGWRRGGDGDGGEDRC